ncbi:hypothetical protein KSD_42450 [Ktedonobacter sp. SOSP1-85]|nr:hypothetical protein KSD_42450 [Ktedonobacter sp. SOSP1-85]
MARNVGVVGMETGMVALVHHYSSSQYSSFPFQMQRGKRVVLENLGDE